MNKYSPIISQFWSNPGNARWNTFALNTGAATNTVPTQDYTVLGSPKTGLIFSTFNKEDRPFLSRAAIFANFADGLPFVRDVGLYKDFPGIALKFDTVGGPVNLANIPIPAFNSWFELGFQIPPPGGAAFALWAGMQSFQFYTASIDTAYNGQQITFTCAVEVTHTFPLT